MDFNDFLKTSAQEIDQELIKFFEKWSEIVKAISPKLIGLNNNFIQANEGGKRLRGALVKLGYELAGGTPTLNISKPAAAFEIFQTAILAHDDIIDESPLRRGKPTIYKALGENHYAISQTICLGDLGFFLAEKLIEESNFPTERRVEALASFIETMLQTGLGQMLDVELPNIEARKKETDIMSVFRLKTARYTLVGPLHLGALLAGADDKMLGNLTRFGENLGVAFQIQDDILGVFGDEKTLGKSVTSDIEEGKVTLLYLYALENGGREELEEIYGGKVGVDGLEKARQIFIKTGALEYSQNKAQELVKLAQETILGMEVSKDKKKLLLQMADFLVKRNN